MTSLSFLERVAYVVTLQGSTEIAGVAVVHQHVLWFALTVWLLVSGRLFQRFGAWLYRENKKLDTLDEEEIMDDRTLRGIRRMRAMIDPRKYRVRPAPRRSGACLGVVDVVYVCACAGCGCCYDQEWPTGTGCGRPPRSEPRPLAEPHSI